MAISEEKLLEWSVQESTDGWFEVCHSEQLQTNTPKAIFNI